MSESERAVLSDRDYILAIEAMERRAWRDSALECANLQREMDADDEIFSLAEVGGRFGGARTASPERILALAGMPYHLYLRTPEWREMRRAKVLAASKRCERCSADGRLNVHHLTYERRGREAWNDLIVLCRDCHMAEHGIVGTEPEEAEAYGKDVTA